MSRRLTLVRGDAHDDPPDVGGEEVGSRCGRVGGARIAGVSAAPGTTAIGIVCTTGVVVTALDAAADAVVGDEPAPPPLAPMWRRCFRPSKWSAREDGL